MESSTTVRVKILFCSFARSLKRGAALAVVVMFTGLSLGTRRSSLRILWYPWYSACSSAGCTTRQATASQDSNRASESFSSSCVSKPASFKSDDRLILDVFEQGSLIALSSLSVLHNVMATRPLFVRERSNAYYRFVFPQLL